MTGQELYTLLKEGGPLGLAVICILAAVHFYRAKEELRDQHARALETLTREHAVEIARLNDKRIEDMAKVLTAIGTFDTGRAAIVDSLEMVAATLMTLKEKILELLLRNQGAG